MACNRGTDFTTNHDAVLAVAQRYREQHEKIETDLEQYFSGLRAVYGRRHRGLLRTGKLIYTPQPSTAAIFKQTATVPDLRLMSEMTGGQMSAFPVS